MLISQDDAYTFNEIVQSTSAHKKRYKPSEFSFATTNHRNFRDFVKTSGEALLRYMVTSNAPIDYVHWDGPNELVDCLRLLAERQAGNQSHDNEIQSIIEELREAEIIY